MFTMKIKKKISVDLQSKFKKLVDEKFAEDVDREVVSEIKKLISAGVSPVETNAGRRFKGYKDPDSYPNKQKQKRPVNLRLSGDMLSYYVARVVNGLTLRLGIQDAPEEIKIRAQANNVGTGSKDGEFGIAARRFVPLKGETFKISVLRKLKNLYAKRIKTLLSKK